MMDKIVRINMTSQTIDIQPVKDECRLCAGRRLTSTLIRRQVPPTCHPLSARNKLVISPGLLTSTAAATAGRLSIGTKSPLTGGIKESNVGGLAAQKLARLGIKALIFEGKPDPDAGRFFILHITKEKIALLPADEYAGKGNYEVSEKLRARFGKDSAVMTIGPAGEMRLSGACISVTDLEGHPARAAGRGGVGAVMGSKRIKAIIIDDSGVDKQPLAKPEEFKEANKRWVKMIREHGVSGQALPEVGTAVLINILNEAGGLPTKNFRAGRFEHASAVSGETMVETIKARGGKHKHGCHPGCVIQCSNVYPDKAGKHLTSALEYETIWAFGPNCLVKDMDDIAMLDRLCDDLGLDTIEMGVTIGIAMEAGVLPWGDGKGAIDLLKRVATGDALGRVIGSGAAITGKVFGVDRVPVVKGQALPAYDPRAVKGVGLTFATSPMGADHTAGYAVATNILKSGGYVDPLKKEGNVELSRNLQIATAAIDTTGLCLFVAFPVLDNENGVQTIVDLINNAYGTQITPDDFAGWGKSILKDELEFNREAGFTKAHDKLPEFFKEELPPHNTTWDFTPEEVDQVLNLD